MVGLSDEGLYRSQGVRIITLLSVKLSDFFGGIGRVQHKFDVIKRTIKHLTPEKS